MRDFEINMYCRALLETAFPGGQNVVADVAFAARVVVAVVAVVVDLLLAMAVCSQPNQLCLQRELASTQQ